ncbi:Oidioi.mRNA.OKI2018_I69.PAR.g9160.t1.cds [Oikopleura dioica]|uniref:Oidioi.mRNA.OKI2018_I69.PAR.g9160.t1.cds n=1 Tax=Oikopleura dioica TaxID=34765 RepID=A0ABN7RKC5_OIKDI|nr:Oidioi.mRNA.OKI2018_I69.PAR.g9160.t1.cds [Oikopleura dioica]
MKNIFFAFAEISLSNALVEPSSWTPPARYAYCEESLIGETPLRATEVDGGKQQFETTCEVNDNEEYEVKVKVECIVDTSTEETTWFWGKDGNPLAPTFYQIFVDHLDKNTDTLQFFGDDVREAIVDDELRSALFFHDYDCTESGYMNIVVKQWFGEDGKTYRRMEIDEILRAILISDESRILASKTSKFVHSRSLLHGLRRFKKQLAKNFDRGFPLRATEIDGGKKEFESACDVKDNEEYEIKVKVECIVDVSTEETTWFWGKGNGKWSHIVKSFAGFEIRTVSDGNPSTPTFYQIFVDHLNKSTDTLQFFGDDVREAIVDDELRSALFFHDYDCSEEGYMSIVVNQWFGEDGEIFRRLEIDGVLRAILISDRTEGGSPILNQVGGSLSWAPHAYVISDLGVKEFEIRSFRPKCARYEVLPKNIKVNWKVGKRICRFVGGELAHFETHEEFELFQSAREGLERSDWIGVRRTKRGNRFIGLDRQEPPFFNWDESQPDNGSGNENCVEATENNKWNDVPCSETRGIICRFEDDC